jgi:hypothetical protein
MQFPKSLHAEGWHAHIPHLRLFRDSGDLRPARRGKLPVMAAIVAVAALTASVGLAAVNDPRPLDQQLSSAMHRAGETLKDWQAQLSHGLKVSLRAVADGRDVPAAQPPASQAAVARVTA